MELLTEFNYELTTPIEYALKGELEKGKFITLKAPTSRVMKECAVLKQAFFRALPKGGAVSESSKEVDKGEEDIDGDGIMTIIMISPDVELSDVLLTARSLFTSGLALVDGETKLTKPIMEQVSNDDLEGMTGAFMANFILASVLQKMNQA